MMLGDNDDTPVVERKCRFCHCEAGFVESGSHMPAHPPYFCKIELSGEWAWCATKRVGWTSFRYAEDLFE